MNLEILISTMNLKSNLENYSLIKNMKIGEKIKTLTINQITEETIEKTNNFYEKNRIISKCERGISKSRNLAIENAKGDICIFADDDVTYRKDFEKIILEEYNKNKDYDILCFYVESSNKNRKLEKIRTSKIGKYKTMKICSVEITFKRKAIIENNIKFDEKFGAGSVYMRGEESIFLCDCLDKKMKIKFVNKTIADVKQEKSTWFDGYDKKFFEDQGVVFYRGIPKIYKVLILKFAIGKYQLYKGRMKITEVIKYMENGVTNYKRQIEITKNNLQK